MSEVVIRPVTSRRDRRAFIKLPYRLYRTSRNWVPPLRYERRQFLDRAQNPYFQHAEAEYFLAWRDGRVVGRITAQVDAASTRSRPTRGGLFGFFECERDPEAAAALLDAAARWLRAKRAATAWWARRTSP